MSDLMSQDTGYLGLIVCRGYQATMDEDRASGQRERIDTGIVDERELVRVPARLGLTRESAPRRSMYCWSLLLLTTSTCRETCCAACCPS